MQSRVRGTALMAVSNKFGGMVMTTGNKSEMSVGYATLYGDMNGGFNPIKDLYKMEVYRLARWRNAHVPKGGKGPGGVVIPENIITRPPTAELRENQTDRTRSPYEVLDDILACLVEREMPLTDIVARGHAPEVIKKVERLLYLAEYKRRQAAPGVKISARTSAATVATPSPTSFVRISAPGRPPQRRRPAPTRSGNDPGCAKAHRGSLRRPASPLQRLQPLRAAHGQPGCPPDRNWKSTLETLTSQRIPPAAARDPPPPTPETRRQPQPLRRTIE